MSDKKPAKPEAKPADDQDPQIFGGDPEDSAPKGVFTGRPETTPEGLEPISVIVTLDTPMARFHGRQELTAAEFEMLLEQLPGLHEVTKTSVGLG